MPHILNYIRRGLYLDSVALMRMSRTVAAMEGVAECGMMMGTPANKRIMADAGVLAAMYSEAVSVSERFAKEEGCIVEWSKIWDIQPIPFHPELIAFCEAAILETVPRSHKLPSGPLHDAAEVSRAGIPTVMMFVQSLRGISHNKIEDTRREHLEMAVQAMGVLAERTADWILREGIS